MNKILQNTIYFFVAIIVIWAGFQNQVFAQSFYSDSNDHYSFTLPNGWKEIPKNIIDQFVAKVVQQTQGQLNIKYDSGFQLADKEYFQHPYFLIQEYSINSPSYNEIEKMLNDANFSKEKERVTEKYSEFFGNFNFDKPFIDKQKGMVFMNINASVPNAGAVKGLLAIFLGDKHTTRLFFYTLETEYSQWLPAFKSIVDSFQYETNYAYNPTKAIKNDSPYILDGVAKKSLGGAFIAGIIGLIAVIVGYLFKKRNKTKQFKTEKSHSNILLSNLKNLKNDYIVMAIFVTAVVVIISELFGN